MNKEEEWLKNVAVIGAAGKMGSGISLLLLQEMARLEAEQTGAVGSGLFRLNLIDSHESGLIALRKYLRTQMTKFAEKQINDLRKYFAKNAKLVSNEEMIQAFVEGSMDMVLSDTQIDNARNSKLIFEAIVEDIQIKTALFSKLRDLCHRDTLYLSNTSSIPISLLNELSGFEAHIIGFHFYNPPAVQKLVEIVYPQDSKEEQRHLITWLAKKLGKTTVEAKDVAGFIGNGHFIREATYACKKAQELTKTYSLSQSVYMVNKVTQDFLIRPMGLFQLMDYVGIDVCQKIALVMSRSLKDESIHSDLIDKMISLRAIGGHHPDGSQKEGFFRYENNKLTAVYDPKTQSYVPLNDSLKKEWEQSLGPLPPEYPSWKALANKTDKEEIIQKAFTGFLEQQTLGAKLAREFLLNSMQIAVHLVQEEVAKNMEDVKKVLNLGFFHLYGPEIKDTEKVR